MLLGLVENSFTRPDLNRGPVKIGGMRHVESSHGVQQRVIPRWENPLSSFSRETWRWIVKRILLEQNSYRSTTRSGLTRFSVPSSHAKQRPCMNEWQDGAAWTCMASKTEVHTFLVISLQNGEALGEARAWPRNEQKVLKTPLSLCQHFSVSTNAQYHLTGSTPSRNGAVAANTNKNTNSANVQVENG